MKRESKATKLTLTRDTLRDLTASDPRGIKGGAPTITITFYTCGKTKGKTCNKQCR